jgi:hypothetical protein
MEMGLSEIGEPSELYFTLHNKIYKPHTHSHSNMSKTSTPH